MSSAASVRMGKAFVEVGVNTTKFQQGIKGVTSTLNSMGDRLVGVGRKMAMAGAALGVPIAMATRRFAQFDDAIRATAAVTGSMGRQGAAAIQMLSDKAKDLGATTSFTAVEVANLMTVLGKAGFNPAEVNSMTQSVLNLARATGTDATEAAGILSATLRQFGLGANEASRAADVLTKTANSTFNTVTDLGIALQYAGPVAADLGLSLEDTAAMLGSLGNVGIQGSKAGVALKRLGVIAASQGEKLRDLFGVSNVDAEGNLKPLIQIFDEINAATMNMGAAERMEKLESIFGLLGITAGSVLSKTAGGVRELAEELRDADGTAQATADQMDSGLGGALRILRSSVEAVAIAFGEALAPMLQLIARWTTKLMHLVKEFIESNTVLMNSIAGVAGALLGVGTALIGIGVALKGISLAIAIVTNPLVLIPALLTAAMAALMHFTGALDGFLEKASQTFQGIYDAIVGNDLGLAIDILFKGAEVAFLQGKETLLNFVDDFMNSFYDSMNRGGLQTKAVFLGIMDNLVMGTMYMFDNLVRAIRKSWNYVQSFFVEGFDLEAENKKVDDEMDARNRQRDLRRPGVEKRRRLADEQADADFAAREQRTNERKKKRAEERGEAERELGDFNKLAEEKRHDVELAQELLGDLASAKTPEELESLRPQVAGVIERDHLGVSMMQKLHDAYNKASVRVSRVKQDDAVAGALGHTPTGLSSDMVGTFSGSRLGGMGFAKNLAQKQLDVLNSIDNGVANINQPRVQA
tara:strand:- start:8305 stop:10566 length:2262 start_codon:yes stop_codon:yes gene_type:complete